MSCHVMAISESDTGYNIRDCYHEIYDKTLHGVRSNPSTLALLRDIEIPALYLAIHLFSRFNPGHSTLHLDLFMYPPHQSTIVLWI